MPLFPDAPSRARAETISRLAFCNPFRPERYAHERALLGERYRAVRGGAMSLQPTMESEDANLEAIVDVTARLVEALRARLASGRADASPAEAGLYEDAVIFLLFHRFLARFDALVSDDTVRRPGPRQRVRVAFFGEFAAEWERLMEPVDGGAAASAPGRPAESAIAHLFACMTQVRRAFHHIFHAIIGLSEPAMELRAAVWESVFTHDMRRYRRALHQRMGDIPTLIVGDSGTGKELVARAIGLSRYQPFDPASASFHDDPAGTFYPLNLSALSPTLIESELFGHRRGAYTGALTDRVGWLELSPPQGTVFLDEIGELDPQIQVKLLRVLQSRVFQRLGETEDRVFRGKIIAATNRDLDAEMAAGRFRADFYYRLCADVIRTPTLREQVAQEPATLETLLHYLAGRIVGPAEAPALAAEALAWTSRHLGADYAWPGNVRELEQCLRNILVRRAYAPARTKGASPLGAAFDGVAEGTLTAEELLVRYCTLVYAKCGSYQEAARRLDLDHRTVKARIDPDLLARLRPGNGSRPAPGQDEGAPEDAEPAPLPRRGGPRGPR